MNSNKRINLLVDLVKLALVILIACVLVSVIVFIVSDDPWTAISSFFLGPFTSLRRVGNIIEAASPLMFTALAVIIIFGSGQFSMIAEGSFFIGITGAMVVAIACKDPSCGRDPVRRILRGNGRTGSGPAENEMECKRAGYIHHVQLRGAVFCDLHGKLSFP